MAQPTVLTRVSKITNNTSTTVQNSRLKHRDWRNFTSESELNRRRDCQKTGCLPAKIERFSGGNRERKRNRCRTVDLQKTVISSDG
uniref:Uncharacterized protein n=1 Tax=Helianthus annuus TaxID=4232 RepID=A0A251V2L8_HELAN